MEDRFEIDIRSSRFVGIVDLILRDRNTGAISVIDHKSKSMQSLTKDLRANKRQLYLYAAYVREKYGEFPALLRFNMFRYGEWVDEPFDPKAYEEMQDWTEQTIRRVRGERDWQVSASDISAKSSALCAAIALLAKASSIAGGINDLSELPQARRFLQSHADDSVAT